MKALFPAGAYSGPQAQLFHPAGRRGDTVEEVEEFGVHGDLTACN
jgi:hypothetical protein